MIAALKDIFEDLRARLPHLSMTIWNKLWHIALVEELGLPLSLGKDLGWGNTTHLLDQADLVGLVLTWEYRVAHRKFGHYAAKTPHIDAGSVGDSENDLRRPVES